MTTDHAPILPTALRRNIAVLVALKLVALALIYWLFFGNHADIGGATVAAHILKSTSGSGAEQ